MAAVYEVAAFLAVLIAVLIWQEWRFNQAPLRFVIAVGRQRWWRTRPLLMRSIEDKELAVSVARALEEGGFTPPKVLLFQGLPTMDLILEPEKPGVTASQLSDALRGFSVRIDGVRGDRLPMRYH